MRGIDYYLDNQPTGKRFLKGVDHYLQSYSRQQGKRGNDDDFHNDEELDSAEERSKPLESSAEAGSDAPVSASQPSSAVPEKKFLKGANRYLFQHMKPKRSKRGAASVPFFGLAPSPAVFSSFKSDGQPVLLPKEKRFMRGPNPYLRTFFNYQRPSRKEYDDIQNYVGDALVMELAKTARAMEDEERHHSPERTDFRFDQDEVHLPEVPERESTATRWNAETLYASFPRQPVYSSRLGDKSFGQSKRVFKYPRGIREPTYGARQFMIWNNGEYRLG